MCVTPACVSSVPNRRINRVSCSTPTHTPERIGFTNVAQAVGLTTRKGGQAVWADVNADGWPDAVLGNQFVFINKRETFEELPDAGFTDDIQMQEFMFGSWYICRGTKS